MIPDMCSLIALFEAAPMVDDEIDPEVHERFMNGQCHTLALALHELANMPMRAIVVRRGRSWSIAHVMAGEGDDTSVFLDIGGERSAPEILDELEIDPEEEAWEIVPATPADIEAWIRKKKLYAITPEAMEHARSIAAQFLD